LKFKFLNLQVIKNIELNKLFTYLLISVISLLFACSTNPKYVSKNSSIAVDSNSTINKEAAQLIKPYKKKLDTEMNEVLVISADEFPKEKGKPETKLGNLVADLSFEIAQKYYKDSIDFCLLNFGGLRTSLPKGEITRGKIFELMPFENELVVVTISRDSLHSLYNYLLITGGQPVSQLRIKQKKSQAVSNFQVEDIEIENELKFIKKSSTKVLTTDYLAKGGDNMTFFASPIKYEKVGIKLRDAIIQYCKEQHQQGKQLKGVIDNRLIIHK